MWVIQIGYYKIYGDGGHSAVLRTLPLKSLNRWICGSAFGYAQICPYGQISHISRTLYIILFKEKVFR